MPSLRRHEPLVAGALGALAGALGLRRALRRRAGTHDAPAAQRSVTCACGAEYRVAGQGRHRVLWPAGGRQEDAVLGGTCPACERPLPG